MRVDPLRRSSRETVGGSRPVRPAISRTPCPCALSIAMSSLSGNDNYEGALEIALPGLSFGHLSAYRTVDKCRGVAAEACGAVVDHDELVGGRGCPQGGVCSRRLRVPSRGSSVLRRKLAG